MKSPDIGIPLGRTREEIEACFKPCPICNRIEQDVGGGIYRIQHDLEIHFGPSAKPRRMTTSELLGNGFCDWESVK